MHAILAARSSFSIGESILSPERLIEDALKVGATAVALTDTMSVTGNVDFSKRAKKAGIKPIIGARLRLVDDPAWRKTKENKKQPPEYFITWYALSEKGLRALYRLLTIASSQERFYFSAKLGFDDLYAALASVTPEDVALASSDAHSVLHHKDALSILSRCSDALARSNVFLTLSPIDTPLYDTLNAKAIEIGQALDLPFLVTRPVLYSEGEDKACEIMGAITSTGNVTVEQMWHKQPYIKDFSAKTEEEFKQEYLAATKRLVERRGVAVVRAAEAFVSGWENTDKLVDMVTYEWSKQAPCLPKMAENEFAAVVAACKKGWAERFTSQVFGHKPTKEELADVYTPRLKYELGVLQRLNFSGYFLLVQDVVQFAKKDNILVGPGRGCFIPDSKVIMAETLERRSIQDVRVGDRVIAHDGSTRSVEATLTYPCDEEILELEFDNGIIIRCTKDHEFFSLNKGWISANEITEEHEFSDVQKIAQRLKSASRSPTD